MATYSAVIYATPWLSLIPCYMIKPNGIEQFSDYLVLGEVYKAYIGKGTPILNSIGVEMIYEGKRNTDKWYPVRIIDSVDSAFPRTGVTVASVTVTYGFESAVAETPYAIVAADWKEQGNGNYWLNMGAGEFANEGKYTVKVRTYPIGNDLIFYVEVRDFMTTETIADVPVPHRGTAQAGSPTTIRLAATASAVNGFYAGNIVVITSGLGEIQARIITSYDGGTTNATIYPAWATNPNNTSVYKVIPIGQSMVDAVEPALQAALLPLFGGAILDADLQLHLGAGVGFRNIGNILGQLAQSEFELRTNVFATIAVPAQGITASMARKGVIQYQQVDMSYTKNWAAPDRTYYILYHYSAQQKQDIAKASLGTVW